MTYRKAIYWKKGVFRRAFSIIKLPVSKGRGHSWLLRRKEKRERQERGTDMQTLKQTKCGSMVKVVKLHGEGAVKRRIMDMGITKGVDIYVRKVAPLGDPIEVTVRGYELSLRKADAEMIEVKG